MPRVSRFSPLSSGNAPPHKIGFLDVSVSFLYSLVVLHLQEIIICDRVSMLVIVYGLMVYVLEAYYSRIDESIRSEYR